MGVIVVSNLQGWYEVPQDSSDQVLGDNAREAKRHEHKYRDAKERAANVLGLKTDKAGKVSHLVLPLQRHRGIPWQSRG